MHIDNLPEFATQKSAKYFAYDAIATYAEELCRQLEAQEPRHEKQQRDVNLVTDTLSVIATNLRRTQDSMKHAGNFLTL